MSTIGLNQMGIRKLTKLVKESEGKITPTMMNIFSKELGCTIGTVQALLPDIKKEAIKEADVLALKNKNVKKAILDKDNLLLGKDDEIKSLNDAIKGMQDNLDKARKFTGKQLYDAYSEAVGGKTFDGKPLPEYSKLGTQQKGWIGVSTLVSK